MVVQPFVRVGEGVRLGCWLELGAGGPPFCLVLVVKSAWVPDGRARLLTLRPLDVQATSRGAGDEWVWLLLLLTIPSSRVLGGEW